MGWVLFYDGGCAFCSRSVRRLIKHDPQRRIFFAPLQGQLAAELCLTQHAAKQGGTMILLRESDGEIFMRSAALIELARALGGSWQLFALARFIPRPLRDFAYGMVADHRDWLAGKSTACPLPDAELLKRLRD
jgi:predicted DCC family thiol-disulfide oxidoreductase YuxK